MFKKIDVYIIKRMLAVFFASVLIISGVMLMGDVVKIHNLLFSKNLSLMSVAKIFEYILVFLYIFIIPMSLSIAINYVYSEMSNNSEITALRSSGISVLRLYSPAFVFTVFVFLILFYDVGFIAYKFRLSYKMELTKAFRNKVYVLLKPNVFYNKFNGGVLWTKSLSADHKKLSRVFFSKGNDIFVAKSANLKDTTSGILVSLNTVKMYSKTDNGWSYGHFKKYYFTFSLFRKNSTFNKFDVRYMTIYELYKLYKYKHLRAALYKINKMISISLSVFALSIIAFSSGIVFARGGKSAGIIINIFLFFAFFVLLMAGDSVYKASSLIWPIYLPNIVLGIIGLYMIYAKVKT